MNWAVNTLMCGKLEWCSDDGGFIWRGEILLRNLLRSKTTFKEIWCKCASANSRYHGSHQTPLVSMGEYSIESLDI